MISEQKYMDASQWYDGYNICGSDVFNPWSSMNYLEWNVLDDRPLMMYWNDTAENEALVTLFSNASDNILSTVKGAYVSGKPITINRLSQNSPMLKDKSGIDGDELLNTLLSTGYLTLDRNDSTLARIPNKERIENSMMFFPFLPKSGFNPLGRIKNSKPNTQRVSRKPSNALSPKKEGT